MPKKNKHQEMLKQVQQDVLEGRDIKKIPAEGGDDLNLKACEVGFS